MATYRENIVARLEAIATELAAMSITTMGGQANVKAQDGGTTIDHVGYRKSLLDEMDMLTKILNKMPEIEDGIEGNGADEMNFEIETTYED